MYIIDESYFIREYSIPNVNELQSETGANLNMYIDEKVRLFLQNLLGFELFSDLDSHITDGVLDDDAPQIWQNLVYGVEYQGKKWNGLIYTLGTFKKSLLTPYIFYNYLIDNVTSLSGVGEVAIAGKNTVMQTSNKRLTDAYNDFLVQYQGKRRSSSYPACISRINGALAIDFLGGNSNDYVTLIRFISDNKSDYPTAVTPTFDFENYYGL